MLKLGVFFVALAVVALTACDKGYGPIIFNDTDHALLIRALYAHGPLEWQLEPHQWSGAFMGKSRILQSMAVVENGKTRQYGSDVLEPMLKQIPTQGDALVLIREATIEVRSIKEARRDGIFRKK